MSRRAKGDGTIFKHKTADRWIARLTYDDPVTGERKTTQRSAKTKTKASAELRTMLDRVQIGAPAQDSGVTLDDFAQLWMETTLPASDRKQSTQTMMRSLTRTHVIGSSLGKMPLSKIRATSIERWITQLRQSGKAQSTVRQIYTVARAIGDAAVRDGHLARNPFATVKRPKVDAHEARYLTPAEVAALLDAASESRYAPLFVLLVNTGLRRGEALALRWVDIDLDDAVLRVRGTLGRHDGELVVTDTKTRTSRRSVPLSASSLATLRALKLRQAEERLRAGNKWVDSGFVFTTELGEPCDPRNALRALTVAAKSAKLDAACLHTLRHSAASTMITNGVPLKVVSELLGHAGIAITADTYGHVAPEVSRSAIDVLGSALTSASDAHKVTDKVADSKSDEVARLSF